MLDGGFRRPLFASSLSLSLLSLSSCPPNNNPCAFSGSVSNSRVPWPAAPPLVGRPSMANRRLAGTQVARLGGCRSWFLAGIEQTVSWGQPSELTCSETRYCTEQPLRVPELPVIAATSPPYRLNSSSRCQPAPPLFSMLMQPSPPESPPASSQYVIYRARPHGLANMAAHAEYYSYYRYLFQPCGPEPSSR